MLAPLLAVCALLGSAGHAHACSRLSPIRLGEVFLTDVIIRVTALGYETPPPAQRRPDLWLPESTVRFRVEEVLWGPGFPAELVVNGVVEDRDDFNDVPLPYRFVRRGGRSGNCYAFGYRPGAQYLLFLRRYTEHGPALTPYYSPLGPVNEQVRGPDDPWLDWVRAYLSPCAAPGGRGAELAEVPKAEMEAMEERLGSDLERYRHARCYVARFGAQGSRGERYMRTIDGVQMNPRTP